MESLHRMKCKTLEKFRNFGSGLEKQEGKEMGKEEEPNERTALESKGLNPQFTFGFCETWKSEPWISLFPEVKWVVRLVDHQGPFQHFLWSFTSPKLWALASLFFSHHNCSFCLWKSMYFQKRYSYIKKQNYFYNNVRQNVQIKAWLYSCIFHALYKSSISDRRTWTTRLQKCWTTSGC